MSLHRYADYLFYSYLRSGDFDSDFGDDWRAEEEVSELFHAIMKKSFAMHGYDVGDMLRELSLQNLGWLKDQSVLRVEGDEYTGIYLRLAKPRKAKVVGDYIDNNEVGKRIQTLGPVALERALRKMSEEFEWPPAKSDDQSVESMVASLEAAPASDRLVTFTDNQANELTAGLDSISAQLRSGSNEIGEILGDDAPRVAVELDAGAILVKSGFVRLEILKVLLIKPLKFLADKFAGAAVGELAKNLIIELLKLIA